LAERDYAIEHEEALAENNATREAAAKQYSIKDAVRRANEIISVVDDVLGEIRFGVLTSTEFDALNLSSCKTKEDMLKVVIAAMFKKASPEVTLADIEALPADDYTIISGVVAKYLPGFLRVGRQILKDGLNQTSTPKSLA
jgi:hypothetical protein